MKTRWQNSKKRQPRDGQKIWAYSKYKGTFPTTANCYYSDPENLLKYDILYWTPAVKNDERPRPPFCYIAIKISLLRLIKGGWKPVKKYWSSNRNKKYYSLGQRIGRDRMKEIKHSYFDENSERIIFGDEKKLKKRGWYNGLDE
ncbi:MAG: hypothetical protein ABIH09_02100 [Candidatus Omnitrophota bacterium]